MQTYTLPVGALVESPEEEDDPASYLSTGPSKVTKCSLAKVVLKASTPSRFEYSTASERGSLEAPASCRAMISVVMVKRILSFVGWKYCPVERE